MLPIF